MDLYVSDQPQLVVFPRGMQRNGSVGPNSVNWTSQYGSVVVTAFHSAAASEGMNEAGLGVHMLYLDKTQYPQRNLKEPGLSDLLWAQYMLDQYSTVDQVVDAMKHIQIVSAVVHGREWPIHLAVEDASGDAAVFEFINGKLVIHHGPQYTVVTNEPAYDMQLANLKNYKLFGGSLPMPGDIDPLGRFVRASSYLKTLPAPDSTVAAVAGIASVMRTTMVPFGAEDTSTKVVDSTDTWPTRWLSIQDLTHKMYYFNSTMTPNLIWVDFSQLNFAPNAPALSMDPNDVELSGDVSAKMMPYSHS